MSESVSDLNRKHFDTIASTYDDKPWVKVGLKQLSAELLAKREWMGVKWTNEEERGNREVKMLDFACGPGMASATFAPYTTLTHGIDVSPSMADEYNRRARLTYPPSRMFATAGDLLGPSPDAALNGSEFWNYDVAVVDMAFHHFSDPALAARRLVQRLKEGGVLVVVDLVADGKKIGDSEADPAHEHGHGHGLNGRGNGRDANDRDEDTQAKDAAHTVAHHGFSKERMIEILETAGCVDVDLVVLGEPFRVGGKMVKTTFMAKGRRA